jgi:hypothetical protein
MAHNEKPKLGPKQVSSPGFLMQDKKLVFEQIEHGVYAMYSLEKGTLLYRESGPITDYYDEQCDVQYLPLKRVPWPLTEPKLTFTLLEEATLWQDVKKFIYDHVDVVEAELYDVLTAWVFATYIPEVWMVVPYIFAYGPVATGKTRLLETLQILGYRGIIGSNVSTASLFRGCELWHPTVFLDEAEIYSNAEHAEIIGLLNAGYRRGQFAWRVKNSDQGTELELFDVFGFKALSGTEGLAKTLESRSIMIRMIKNTRPVEFLLSLEKARELRGRLLMWRFLKLRELSNEGYERYERYSKVPSSLEFSNGRLIELFQPLVAVSNEGSENIVKYAKKVFEIRQLEEETTVEAMVLNALIDSKSKLEENVILTKDIRDTLNIDIPKKEQFKTTTVGRIMRRLGFICKHTLRGNGWVWNDSRVQLLKSRYLPRDDTSEKSSYHSYHSGTSVPGPEPEGDFLWRIIPPAEKCELCGKLAVEYEINDIKGSQIFRRCQSCFNKMRCQLSKASWINVQKDAG